MHKSFGILLATCLLAATPSMAGNLTFNEGQPAWHPANCTKPVPPESILNADPETAGNNMNAMVARYNAYAQEAQAYMNCVSNEAVDDQKVISQAITAGAQGEIAATNADVERMYTPLQGPLK